jgi:4-diphosphocytidyl-2C-methyl-D-erythritol kinase
MADNVLDTLTKYELQTLLWGIHYVRERTNNCGDAMRALQTKVQAMVDSYCEHEYYLSGCGACAVAKCNKCGFSPKVENNE